MSTTERRFRFGVQSSEIRDSAAWKEQARKAEALGYDILVMPDHHGLQFAIGPALAVAADVTSTLRIGTLVLQNDLRHPAWVAMEAATLDILSDGRFELGLGAGGSLMLDYEATGLPFDPPGLRVGRLDESVRIIKGLFAGGQVTFAGRHYTITELHGIPTLAQRPHPPILIGGGGPRLLRLAAREANIISIFPALLPEGGSFRGDESSTAAVANKVDLIRQAAPERFADLEFHVLVQAVVVTEQRQAELERLSPRFGLSAEDLLDSPYFFVGTVEQIAVELRSYRERLGLSYFGIFEHHMDAFAPVVAALTGQ